MGKRELLLIAAFAVLGVVVYQVSAPASAPGSEGAGLSAIWHNLQRHVKGNQATAAADSTESALADGVRELRITIARSSTITITGEDRHDVSATLHVTARGFDDQEARASSTAIRLRLERAGDAIVVRTEMAGSRPRSAPPAQVTIALRVPRQLAVRVEPNSGALAIANVAALDVMGARGELRASSIAGTATITHASGPLTIDGCGSLKLTNRGGAATVRNVAGTTSIDPTGGGVTIDRVTGPLDVDSRGADVTLSGLDALEAPLRINAVGGRLGIDGLRTETRIDARNAPVELSLAAPAAVTVYSTAQDIAITPASGGYTLDAVATDGRVTIADADLHASESNGDSRASGPVRGGGPALVLRATHANIDVRAHRSGK